MTPDEFFADQAVSKQLYEAVTGAIGAIGAASQRVSKSQIAFSRRRAFAWVWMPGQYLKGHTAPLVLSLSLPWRDGSPRWKEIVESAPGHFMHHLELTSPAEIDAQAGEWLRQAWEAAG